MLLTGVIAVVRVILFSHVPCFEELKRRQVLVDDMEELSGRGCLD